MTTRSVITPPEASSGWHVLVAATSAVVAVGGLLGAVLGHPSSLVLIALGVIGLSWGMSRRADNRVLRRLSGHTMGQLSVRAPILPATSRTPERDVAGLPAGVPAIVRMPDGSWGLVARETAEAAAAHVGFDGRWHRVAQPPRIVGPDLPVTDLGTLPREGEVVLVAGPGETPRAVTGLLLRERASALAARDGSWEAVA